MTLTVRVLIMCAITAIVVVVAALNPSAGHSERAPVTPSPWQSSQYANAKAFADWCGGYVQLEHHSSPPWATDEFILGGCDK